MILDHIIFRYLPFLMRFPSVVGVIVLGLPVVIVVCTIYWFCRRAQHKKRLGTDFAETRRKCRLNELVRLLFIAWFTMLFLLCLTTDWGSLVYNFSDPLVLLPPIRALRCITSFDYRFTLLQWGFERDMFLNTVLFIPLGAALPILWKKADFGKTTLIGFLLTFFIEMRAQPLMSRNPSLDDVIFNTLGTVIGYLIFMLLRKIFPKFIEKCQLTVKAKPQNRKAKQNV